MTEEEIQKEVETRVRFKLEQFFTGMENRIKANRHSAFSLVLSGDYKEGQKAENYKEAWSHVKAAFKKEIEMNPLSQRMAGDAQDMAHTKAVDNIMQKLESENRGMKGWRNKQQSWVNFLIKEIHDAQRF